MKRPATTLLQIIAGALLLASVAGAYAVGAFAAPFIGQALAFGAALGVLVQGALLSALCFVVAGMAEDLSALAQEGE